ncbi:FkbM family methyltransferase [Gluconacetobacter sp. Hr-1-5]|uniref:FkbM family methyltransferase n=1 Tax=Gluconacetobacter sp. Hr-1-5 TaxID=3395370 RepID=UPI003B517AF9
MNNLLVDTLNKDLSNEDFVKVLYNIILNRPADDAGLSAHVSSLKNGRPRKDLINAFTKSPEFRSGYYAEPENRWPEYSKEDIDFLQSWEIKDQKPLPGFVTDFVGQKTRISSLWHGCEGLDNVVLGLPVPSDYRSGAGEWIGTLRAVAATKGDSFSAIELGAGNGPWITAAGKAAELRGIKNIYLVGVEGDPARFETMQQHIKDNALDKYSVELIQGAVGIENGTARWPILTDPKNEASARPMQEGNSEDEKYLSSSFNLENMIEVKVLSFSYILSKRPLWDFIHIDIQGGEYDICNKTISILNEKVRYIIIGTHSRKLDGDLIDLFFQNGWCLENEHPTVMNYNPNLNSLLNATIADGLQVWRNPRL